MQRCIYENPILCERNLKNMARLCEAFKSLYAAKRKRKGGKCICMYTVDIHF